MKFYLSVLLESIWRIMLGGLGLEIRKTVILLHTSSYLTKNEKMGVQKAFNTHSGKDHDMYTII